MLVPRLGDHPAAAEHLPLADGLPPRQGHVLPCAQCSRGGQGGTKPLLVPMAGMLVPWQALPRGAWQCWAGRGVSTSPWQRQNCTAGTLFPTKFPNWGDLGPHQCQSRCGVSPWWWKQTCLAGRPFSLLWIKTSTAPLGPALCEGLPQNATRRRNPARGGTATPHTHRQSTGLGLERGLA